MVDKTSLPSASGFGAHAAEREFKRVLRNALHERPDQPSKTERDTASERNGLALLNSANRCLFERAIGIDAPQVAAAVVAGDTAFRGGAGTLHFVDVLRDALGVELRGTNGSIVHVI